MFTLQSCCRGVSQLLSHTDRFVYRLQWCMLPDSGAHSHTRPANLIGLPANSPGRVTTLLADHIAVVCVCISIHGEKKKILHFSSGPCGDQFCHSCTGRCDRERGRREILARACGSAAVINAVISSSARNVLCVCVRAAHTQDV